MPVKHVETKMFMDMLKVYAQMNKKNNSQTKKLENVILITDLKYVLKNSVIIIILFYYEFLYKFNIIFIILLYALLFYTN